MNEMLKNLLEIEDDNKQETIGKSIVKKRGKNKVEYIKINDLSFKKQLTELANVNELKISPKDEDIGEKIVLLLEEYIKGLLKKSYEDKVSFSIKFLGTTLNIDYHNERKSRNPLKSENIVVPPKIQIKLLSDRYDENNLKLLLNKPRSMNSNISKKYKEAFLKK